MSGSVSIGTRRLSMSWKEGALALAGGLALAAGLVAILRPSASIEEDPVSVSPPPQPPPAAAITPSVPAPSVPARPAASAEGLVLFGVLGGAGDRASAIIGAADGSQRLVRIGREAAPGITLRAVEATAVLLSDGGRTVRLALADGAGRSSVTPVETEPGGTTGSTPSSSDPYRRRPARDETTEFRLGLVARTEQGQTTGFAIRPDAQIPIFRQAGLQPGDVVFSVNGRAFASEREIDGLSREIGLSKTLVVGYERGGVRHEARVNIAEK